MDEVKKQLGEIKQLFEKGLLTEQEYVHIRRQLVKKLHQEERRLTTPPEPPRKNNHNLRAVPNPVAVANGSRWSSDTSIRPGSELAQNNEVASNETIIPMGMFEEVVLSEGAETIVPEQNSLNPQTIVPVDMIQSYETIVPQNLKTDNTIIPVTSLPLEETNVALISGEGTYMEDTYFIKSSKTTVGRSQENHLVIYNDPTVSRVHCEIYYQNNTFIIHDNNSFHGTFINGQRINQSILSNADQIQLGNTVIRFRFM